MFRRTFDAYLGRYFDAIFDNFSYIYIYIYIRLLPLLLLQRRGRDWGPHGAPWGFTSLFFVEEEEEEEEVYIYIDTLLSSAFS